MNATAKRATSMEYIGTGDYAGDVLGTAIRASDGTYYATQWVAGSYTAIERRGGLTEQGAKDFLRSDRRPGRLRRTK
jgi:hypothetical protein